MTARPDSTRTAVVDDTHEWRRMSDCPPHRKCLLRNAGGMPVIGVYDGRDPQWTGWVPPPVVPDWMRGGKQMTDAEIKSLRDLMRAATPGPWVLEDKERSNLVSNGEVWVEAVVARNYQEINDAALIVAAVNALPSLLGEVERLRCRNEVLWNALWKVSGDHEPHVAANLESVGGNPADFLDDDMNGEHDDRQ